MNERLGTELSAAARQVIAEARGADDPTAEDEARVKARWLAGIAAGAGVSSLSEAVRAAASTGWGLKAGALAAALAAATAGVYLGWPQRVESSGRNASASATSKAAPSQAPVTSLPVAPAAAPAPSVVRSPAAALPAAALPAAALPSGAAPAAAAPGAPTVNQPEEQPAPESEAAPSAAALPPTTSAIRAAHAPTAPRNVSGSAHRAVPEKPPAPLSEQLAPAAAPALSGQLGEEIALLSEIRSHLQSGAPARALEQLADYRQRFGQPTLAMEADALQVDALCRAGQRDAARAAASAFTSHWPGSPLQQRVSAACP